MAYFHILLKMDTALFCSDDEHKLGLRKTYLKKVSLGDLVKV